MWATWRGPPEPVGFVQALREQSGMSTPIPAMLWIHAVAIRIPESSENRWRCTRRFGPKHDHQ